MWVGQQNDLTEVAVRGEAVIGLQSSTMYGNSAVGNPGDESIKKPDRG